MIVERREVGLAGVTKGLDHQVALELFWKDSREEDESCGLPKVRKLAEAVATGSETRLVCAAR